MSDTIESVPAGRTKCPECGNNIAVRITANGVSMSVHRARRGSADLCKAIYRPSAS